MSEVDRRSALDNVKLASIDEKVSALQDGLGSAQRSILSVTSGLQAVDDVRKKLDLLEARVNARLSPPGVTPPR